MLDIEKIKQDARVSALCMIGDERVSQIKKWGYSQELTGTLDSFITILVEEVGELCEAINETIRPGKRPERGGDVNITEEASHVAAVAVKLMEAVLVRQKIREEGGLQS